MSPTLPKDPWGSITSTAINPFDRLVCPKAPPLTASPSKSINITVDQVSNGYIVKVRQNGTTIERIVSDFENLGSEIMTALAEIQLGK